MIEAAGLLQPVASDRDAQGAESERGLLQPVGDNLRALPPLHPKPRRAKPYFEHHRRYQAWLGPQEAGRLRELMTRHQVGFTEFVRLAMEEMERRRPSEAGQYVRSIVPDYVVRLAMPLLLREAGTLQETWHRMDRKTVDGLQRAKNVRGESVLHYDAAAWTSDILKQYDRLADHQPAQSLDPTNPHTRDRVAAHPTTAEEE